MKTIIIAASIAALLASTVTATATELVRSANIKDGTIRNKDIHRGTITGKKIRNHSLDERDFKGSLQGPQGVPGPVGPQGPPGSFSGILPPGKTVVGFYAGTGDKQPAGLTSISFGARLRASPSPHIILLGASSTSFCPGSADSPQAAPGHLCVYEDNGVNRHLSFLVPAGRAGALPLVGVGLQILPTDPSSYSYSEGTWAVTGS